MVLTSPQLKRASNIECETTPRKCQRIIASSASSNAEIDGFPCWAKGTVLIEMHEDSKCQYQLHKAVLERNSTWFAAEFGKTIFEPGIGRKGHLKESIRYLFRLQVVKNVDEAVLSRIASSHCKSRECQRLTRDIAS